MNDDAQLMRWLGAHRAAVSGGSPTDHPDIDTLTRHATGQLSPGKARIVSEHRRRQGDPAAGGSTRQPIMTAYRQQALVCAQVLAGGPARPRDVKLRAPDAAKILRGNVYGWFMKVERGIYALTDGGRAALVRWQAYIQPAAGAEVGPAKQAA